MSATDDLASPQRIRGLAAYDLFNAELQQKLVDVCQRTASQLDAQTVMVTAVLDSATAIMASNHYKNGVPLNISDFPNEMALCPTVVRTREPYVVDDLTTHPDHATNPLVELGLIRAYAGVPIVLPTGDVLGTFCLACDDPHHFTDDATAALTATVAEIVQLIREYELAHQR